MKVCLLLTAPPPRQAQLPQIQSVFRTSGPPDICLPRPIRCRGLVPLIHGMPLEPP